VGNIRLATSSSKTVENYLVFTKPCCLPVNSWHILFSPHVTTHASTVLTCTYMCIYIQTLLHVQFPFPFAQNRILCYHTLYVTINLKKCARSTTLTWFWGSAENISIKPHLLKILNTIHTSNIRISKVACKGRCINFSGEFNGPMLPAYPWICIELYLIAA
jgi:hypothetical protein